MFHNTGANAFAKNQMRLAYEDKRDLYCTIHRRGSVDTVPPPGSRGQALILTREADPSSRIIQRFPPTGGLSLSVEVSSLLHSDSSPIAIMVPLYSTQLVALCPSRPHEKQIASLQSRHFCRSCGGCRCRCR